VAAFTYDPVLAEVAAKSAISVCLMHAQGDPETMQDAPHYADVLLDVYDFLERRITVAEAAGIPRDRIIVDPGIGFGKTTQHCLKVLQRISIFHSLGCIILLGVSRKRFIGDISNTSSAQEAQNRAPGSI
jgi:dihydropteroate synthase